MKFIKPALIIYFVVIMPWVIFGAKSALIISFVAFCAYIILNKFMEEHAQYNQDIGKYGQKEADIRKEKRIQEYNNK